MNKNLKRVNQTQGLLLLNDLNTNSVLAQHRVFAYHNLHKEDSKEFYNKRSPEIQECQHLGISAIL